MTISAGELAKFQQQVAQPSGDSESAGKSKTLGAPLNVTFPAAVTTSVFSTRSRLFACWQLASADLVPASPSSKPASASDDSAAAAESASGQSPGSAETDEFEGLGEDEGDLPGKLRVDSNQDGSMLWDACSDLWKS